MRTTILLILTLAFAGAALAQDATAETLAQTARQQGCTSTPSGVDGTDLYKCQTQAGMAYFSGPPSTGGNTATRKSGGSSAARSPTPASFPRVDTNTQRERDDVRKRVLSEELAAEVKLMVESELMMKQGSIPQANENASSPQYLDRMAKLKQTVDNHTKNVQALNKELERVR